MDYNLKLPVTFKALENEHTFSLTRCHVNYFTNRIGIADLEFHWHPEEDDLSKKGKSDYSIQSMLDLQRHLLEGSDCKIIETYTEKTKDGKKTSKDVSISSNLNELIHAVISKNVDEHPYVLGWSSIDHLNPNFLYSQILIEPSGRCTPDCCPDSADTSLPWTPNCWNHRQLSYWTYLFSTCATSDALEVKDEFLHDFLEKSCYLRWASENGGLWLSFSAHGACALKFAVTKKDVERLKAKKANHQDLLAQIVYPALFQKAFLQIEVNLVRKLINETASAKSFYNHSKVSESLKNIKGNLLRFNLIFCDEIGKSIASNSMFDIWQRNLSVDKLQDNLAKHVADLTSFYSGISGAVQQSKLDLLTVTIGCLGLAQLFMQVSITIYFFLFYIYSSI